MVAKPALGQGGMDFAAVADQIESRNSLVGLQGPFGALDDHSASVVATHDIHCDSHKRTGSGETRSASGNPQAPAVTVMTWRLPGEMGIYSDLTGFEVLDLLAGLSGRPADLKH